LYVKTEEKALVPLGVVTVTKYVEPMITDGEVTWRQVGRAQLEGGLVTTVAGIAGLYPLVFEGLTGAPPDSHRKLTVSSATNPVPLMLIVVPPVVEPEVGLMELTTGTTGFQSQLSCVMLSPQLPLLGTMGVHCLGLADGVTDPGGLSSKATMACRRGVAAHAAAVPPLMQAE
jgi:hypothetical protein